MNSSAATPLGRILLAEDDEAVRTIAVRILERAGYEVITATNGAEGLAALRSATAPIPLILSDILMPEMDGIELAVRAQMEFPATRTVLMTGFSEISKDRERSQGLCEAILGKPFIPADLLETLRHAATRPD
jgi:two-component system cell cycle response regulator CpdR